MVHWLKVLWVKATKDVDETKLLRKTVLSFVSIASTLYATAVLANNLMGFEFIKNTCETNWPLVLVVCAIAALVGNREHLDSWQHCWHEHVNKGTGEQPFHSQGL